MNIPKPHMYLTVLVVFLSVALAFTGAIPTGMVQASSSLAPDPLMAPTTQSGDRFAESWQDGSWNARQDLSNLLFYRGSTIFITAIRNVTWGLPAHLRSMQSGVNGYIDPVSGIEGGTTANQRLIGIPQQELEKSVHSIPIAVEPNVLKRELEKEAAQAEDAPFATYLPLIQAPDNAPKYFSTLPPGSVLPSDAECAAMIKSRAENKRSNLVYNATPGAQQLATNFFDPYSNDPRANSVIAARVTGNYTGTTDEILQWVACKWGIDEDMVRAQAAIESWWRQDTLGDWTTNANNCAPGHGLGVDGRPGECPESFGILQNRYPYEQSAWPGIGNSTAFNADTGYGIWRACFEGYEWWLNHVERGWDYAAGDAWGCMGRWYSGRWHTDAAEYYIGRVKEYYNTRIWEQSSFQEP